MHASGVPKKRRKGIPGANVVACAICGIPGLSVDMAWNHVEAPGWPSTRSLVHPECKDVPNPGVLATPSKAIRPPAVTQPRNLSLTLTSAAPTLTAAVFVATGTTTATVAQITADPTVQLTGTGFSTQQTFGRVKAHSTAPEERTTTVINGNSLTFELEAEDLVAGDLDVAAVLIPPPYGWLVTEVITLTVT